MGIYVNTNVSSLNGRRYLNNVQNQLTTTYQRLSSGLRINSAKDDAAGLQISSRLTTQINGLNQGNRNASDGIALAQTIEGAMDETTNMLQKIRTLAVQAANGTNTEADRKALDTEATALVAEIDRIASQTKFGGKTVLDGSDKGATSIYSTNNGSAGKLTLQVGANKGDTISFDVANMKFTKAMELAGYKNNNNTKFWDNGKKLLLSTAEGAQATIEAIDKIIGAVDSQRAGLGAIQNHSHTSKKAKFA